MYLKISYIWCSFFIFSLVSNLYLIHRLAKSRFEIKVSPVSYNIKDLEEDTQQRLSHIIIPFHWKEIKEVEKTISVWKKYKPCAEYNIKEKPSVLFYSSDDQRREERISEIERRISQAMSDLPVDVLNCFSGFEIQHANLTQKHDVYYEGKRLMLEKIIKGKIKSKIPFYYVFYMDVSTFPIRDDWIFALNRSICLPNEIFWIKGSVYRGSDKNRILLKETSFQKINGNAIYNLRLEDGFKPFFERILKPYVLKKEQSNRREFDSDFYEFLHDLTQVQKSRKVRHKFVYTELIQDHSHSSYKVSQIQIKYPNTYFVHGGYPK